MKMFRQSQLEITMLRQARAANYRAAQLEAPAFAAPRAPQVRSLLFSPWAVRSGTPLGGTSGCLGLRIPVGYDQEDALAGNQMAGGKRGIAFFVPGRPCPAVALPQPGSDGNSS